MNLSNLFKIVMNNFLIKEIVCFSYQDEFSMTSVLMYNIIFKLDLQWIRLDIS